MNKFQLLPERKAHENCRHILFTYNKKTEFVYQEQTRTMKDIVVERWGNFGRYKQCFLGVILSQKIGGKKYTLFFWVCSNICIRVGFLVQIIQSYTCFDGIYEVETSAIILSFTNKRLEAFEDFPPAIYLKLDAFFFPTSRWFSVVGSYNFWLWVFMKSINVMFVYCRQNRKQDINIMTLKHVHQTLEGCCKLVYK